MACLLFVPFDNTVFYSRMQLAYLASAGLSHKPPLRAYLSSRFLHILYLCSGNYCCYISFKTHFLFGLTLCSVILEGWLSIPPLIQWTRSWEDLIRSNCPLHMHGNFMHSNKLGHGTVSAQLPALKSCRDECKEMQLLTFCLADPKH